VSDADFVAALLTYFAAAGKGLTESDLKKIIATVFPEQADGMMAVMAEHWTQQGWRDGVLNGIKLALDIKFGADGVRLMPEIRQIKDRNKLKAVQRALKAARSPDEVRRVYQ